MRFEYCYMTQATGQIDVEDIGNVTIQGFSDLGKQYLLSIHTELGDTKILEIGPLPIDCSLPKELYPNRIGITYDRIEYKESKICNRIEKFLSNPLVTQVLVVEFNDVKDNFINLVDLL